MEQLVVPGPSPPGLQRAVPARGGSAVSTARRCTRGDRHSVPVRALDARSVRPRRVAWRGLVRRRDGHEPLHGQTRVRVRSASGRRGGVRALTRPPLGGLGARSRDGAVQSCLGTVRGARRRRVRDRPATELTARGADRHPQRTPRARADRMRTRSGGRTGDRVPRRRRRAVHLRDARSSARDRAARALRHARAHNAAGRDRDLCARLRRGLCGPDTGGQ
jgi:hypothetical protein